MSNNLRHSNSCNLRAVDSNKELTCEVYEFRPKDRLTVIVNKQVKVTMKWNGNIYEGKMAGLEFVSEGPQFNNIKTSIRG